MNRRDPFLYVAAKRVLDVLGALVGLSFTALFYIPLAIAIKLDSPGPVLFGQERLGKDESTFRLFKFRTMYLGPSLYGPKPATDDDRVTRVGRLLRRTSLDELPQFYNILRGEMSLVGPRPEQLPLAAHYRGSERRRFEVKPGLTGWWQVSGRKQPMYEHGEDDLYYVEHRSLRLDLLILLRTARAVITGEGAL